MDILNNIWSFFFRFFELLNDLATNLNNFLFDDIEVGFTIPIVDLEIGFTFSPFWAVGLPLAVTLLVMSIVKRFIPLA